MSDLGKTINDIKSQGSWKLQTISPKNIPIGIKTPLEKGKDEGETLFKMHFNIVDQIQDNLKNLIMTQRGERLGFPDYGTSLRTIYSNTSISEDQIAEYASKEIKDTVTKYMPNIRLIQFYSDRVSSSEVKNDAASILGLKYMETQSSTSIGNPSIIDINKDNPNLNSLYKITVEYNIPILNENKSRIIKLYINNSK
jgi:phage baseplate assembly protein W